KDECSDFQSESMDSKGLAIRNGKIIDEPVPVRLPAICSIETMIDCNIMKKKNINTCDKNTVCSNVDT
ncbi:hypothetical protein PENTCL1PPCAC_3381, partial [Pristionchus entomophagus]